MGMGNRIVSIGGWTTVQSGNGVRHRLVAPPFPINPLLSFPPLQAPTPEAPMSFPEFHSLREKLDDHHTWPEPYTFKFVVPADQVPLVEKIFSGHELKHRHSSGGKYVGLTALFTVHSTDEVIRYYEMVSTIKGAITL